MLTIRQIGLFPSVKNGVLFTKYDYWDIDILGGLTMAIHSCTENQIDLTSFRVNSDNTYSGNLRFTFKDNFGLDSSDLDQGYLAGFRSWFILQHLISIMVSINRLKQL